MVYKPRCPGHNCYYEKSKTHDQIPQFNFPKKSQQITTTSAVEVITDAFTSVTETIKPSSTSEAISSTMWEMVGSVTETLTDIINTSNNTVIDTAGNSNNTNIVGITEVPSNSSIIDSTQNGALPINGSLTTLADKGTEVLTTWSSVIQTTAQSIISDLNSSTHNIIKSITDATEAATQNIISDLRPSTDNANKTITSVTDHAGHEKFEHHSKYDNGHASIYAILGIILAVLIAMIIIFVIIYVKYRKNTARKSIHQYYEINAKKEPSPPAVYDDTSKNTVNDIYVQYSC